MAWNELAPELQNAIISYSDKGVLKNYSLVCRGWVWAAQILLFREIYLARGPATIRLARMLQTSPHLGSYVRYLGIESYGNYDHSAYPLVAVLASLRLLRKITFVGFAFIYGNPLPTFLVDSLRRVLSQVLQPESEISFVGCTFMEISMLVFILDLSGDNKALKTLELEHDTNLGHPSFASKSPSLNLLSKRDIEPLEPQVFRIYGVSNESFLASFLAQSRVSQSLDFSVLTELVCGCDVARVLVPLAANTLQHLGIHIISETISKQVSLLNLAGARNIRRLEYTLHTGRERELADWVVSAMKTMRAPGQLEELAFYIAKPIDHLGKRFQTLDGLFIDPAMFPKFKKLSFQRGQGEPTRYFCPTEKENEIFPCLKERRIDLDLGEGVFQREEKKQSHPNRMVWIPGCNEHRRTETWWVESAVYVPIFGVPGPPAGYSLPGPFTNDCDDSWLLG
ncbi:hypothetical protein C8J56DRAFT_928303 [Mycena floridula]|nr:hypothetical protein C8J56DRAFT_928303 [Mycena floridula]